MKIYLAPMEGITGYVYRNAYRKFYADANRYFTPFISTHEKLGAKVIREISPDNNQGIDIVPQIMVRSSDEAKGLFDLLEPYGYEHFNINAGCPVGTVSAKGRGSGLLRDVDNLERLLTESFDFLQKKNNGASLSIKTRIGWSDINEWENIAKLYGQFPFSEVIIHGRVREEFYNGTSHRECLDIAKEYISSPVIYNGDIYSVSDLENLTKEYPWINGVMIGRGVLRNPELIEQCIESHDELNEVVSANNDEHTNKDVHTSKDMDLCKLKCFMTTLYDTYLEIFKSEINTLYHMKELWFHLGMSFPDHEKELKTIKKTKSVNEYKNAVNRIWS